MMNPFDHCPECAPCTPALLPSLVTIIACFIRPPTTAAVKKVIEDWIAEKKTWTSHHDVKISLKDLCSGLGMSFNVGRTNMAIKNGVKYASHVSYVCPNFNARKCECSWQVQASLNKTNEMWYINASRTRLEHTGHDLRDVIMVQTITRMPLEADSEGLRFGRALMSVPSKFMD